MSERRKEIRVPVLVPLDVYDHGAGELLGELANLSLHGMLLLSRRCIDPNRILQVDIPLPESLSDGGMTLCLGIESLWAEEDATGDQYWCGFQIIDYAPQALHVLEKLIAEFS